MKISAVQIILGWKNVAYPLKLITLDNIMKFKIHLLDTRLKKTCLSSIVLAYKRIYIYY